MSRALDSVLNVKDEVWDIPYLMGRYGVSRSTITGAFFSCGIPKEKISGKYVFFKSDVLQWEITQRCVPYGKKDCVVLPAFKEYSERLIGEIKEQKKKKNGDELRELVQEGMDYGVDLYSELIEKIKLAGLFILAIVLLSLVWH